MARPLRIEYSGAVYHVTSRGNEKKEIFNQDSDRVMFFEILKETNKKYNWLCHAYCLMNNHYHLIVETPDGNLSKGMRQLNSVYTQYFNKVYDRVGHLFQGRYKAILIQKESHLLEACRYIVLNPIRAKVVENIEEWKWSSFHGTGGSEPSNPCLIIDWILGQFDKNKKIAQQRYVEFIKAGVEKKSIWEDVKGQIILGNDDFVDSFKDQLKNFESIKEIPRIQRYMGRPLLIELFKESMLIEKDRRNKIIKEAIYKYGYSQKEVGDYLKLSSPAISKINREKVKSKDLTL